jgi:hypothetical protein
LIPFRSYGGILKYTLPSGTSSIVGHLLTALSCEKRRKKEETLWLNNRRRDLALAFRTLLGFGATRPPTTYETIREANDLPKITYTPSSKE